MWTIPIKNLTVISLTTTLLILGARPAVADPIAGRTAAAAQTSTRDPEATASTIAIGELTFDLRQSFIAQNRKWELSILTSFDQFFVSEFDAAESSQYELNLSIVAGVGSFAGAHLNSDWGHTPGNGDPTREERSWILAWDKTSEQLIPDQIVALPEPPSLILLTMGLLWVAISVRRKLSR
jgi:hypothetical protein